VLTVDNDCQARRTCLSVPASSGRFLARARDLPADEVMLDLEDSVAPAAKEAARGRAVAALAATSVAALGYDGKWVLHPAQVDVDNEASRKMALMVAAKGEAAGLSRTS